MASIIDPGLPTDFAYRLAACGDTEPAAVAELYDHYRPMLERFARRNGARDPEGTANLAFYDGVRAIERLRNRSEPSFRSYVFRAAANRIASEKRKKELQVTSLQDQEPRHPAADIDEMVVESDWVHELVESLPADQREVINDRFFVGYSTRETAHRLGKTPGAVRKLQHDAIARLRHALVVVGVAVLFATGLLVVSPSGPVARRRPRPPQRSSARSRRRARLLPARRRQQLLPTRRAPASPPTRPSMTPRRDHR